MTISPIGGIGSALQAAGTQRTTPTTGADGDFGGAIGNALAQLQNAQTKADSTAQLAATGQLTDVHELTIASTEAQVATEITTAVRNRAVEAFNEIMRMPV